MIIEFADPGIDWTPVFWFLAALALGVVLFVAPFGLPSRYFEEWMPVPGVAIAIFALVGTIATAVTISSVDYDTNVDTRKVAALEKLGFRDVTLRTPGFVASKNGDFFNGALVNLNPDSGYRYEVLELKSTE